MISIVIPNYNGKNLLEKNLPKVFQSLKGYDAEVIVVDDASKDESLKFLKTEKVRVVKNSKNLGFSSTANKGVGAAKGEIVILLNTDVYPQKDFLKALIPHFKNPDVFAVGCLDKSIEDGKIVFRGRGIGKWEKGILIHRKGDVNKNDTLWASGGSAAFRKLIWDKLGGLDTLYSPFYWEDIDLSYRALKSGYKVLFEKKSIVYHEHKKGAIKSNYSENKIKTIAYKNQFIFSFKNATDYNLQLKILFFMPLHLLKAILRFDKPFILGFLKAFFILPKIIKSSFNAQKLFIKSDKEVVNQIT